MSRLNEIIENHDNLDQLFSIMKHYGVNAQFVADSLCKEFEQRSGQEGDGENKENEADQAFALDIVEDLKLFTARF